MIGDPDGPSWPTTETEVEPETESSDDKYSWDTSGVPSYLRSFWDELLTMWFGEDEDSVTFKDMIIEDMEYQAGVTEDYTEKLDDLESTYTSEPYTFDFQILGQTVKNIPQRSLSTISTLSELAEDKYKADLETTPNKGETEYMSLLKELIQGMSQYQEDEDEGSWWDESGATSEWMDIAGTLGSLFMM